MDKQMDNAVRPDTPQSYKRPVNLTPGKIADIVKQECIRTDSLNQTDRAKEYGISRQQLIRILDTNKEQIDKATNIIVDSIKADLKRAGKDSVKVLVKGLRSRNKIECAKALLDYGIGKAQPDSVTIVQIPQMVIRGRNNHVPIDTGATIQGTVNTDADSGAQNRDDDVNTLKTQIDGNGMERKGILTQVSDTDIDHGINTGDDIDHATDTPPVSSNPENDGEGGTLSKVCIPQAQETQIGDNKTEVSDQECN